MKPGKNRFKAHVVFHHVGCYVDALSSDAAASRQCVNQYISRLSLGLGSIKPFTSASNTAVHPINAFQIPANHPIPKATKQLNHIPKSITTMFPKAQWLALALALSATASAAPNPDIVTITVTHTAGVPHSKSSHFHTGTVTAKTAQTILPAGCPPWVDRMVASPLQDKVCKKLPKLTTTLSHTTHSKSRHSHTGTTTRLKNPKPTGLPGGCPSWLEDYVALMNLDEACKSVAMGEGSTTLPTQTATAS
ncbi:hypothetical protein MMC08_002088 [Hypocenomyce scalaris]|nr:hypothetical protein [Hypocenomyce scalaris]